MTIFPTGNYFENAGCDYSAIKENAKLRESLSGTPVDADKEYGDCVRQVMSMADEARRLALEQQQFNRIVLGGVIAAIIAILVILFIYRKPIRAAWEAAFVNVAAKTISSRRNLKEYRADMAQRIREKSGE
ncbi:hypothetical protein LJR098_001095 [Rhizobium sp. LjRoot98]|uniref:hypothetical protein n=1 Tax=Rhizobium sp. LjRoot98 TaxID=3342345 RepID=UPI003ECF2F83